MYHLCSKGERLALTINNRGDRSSRIRRIYLYQIVRTLMMDKFEILVPNPVPMFWDESPTSRFGAQHRMPVLEGIELLESTVPATQERPYVVYVCVCVCA